MQQLRTRKRSTRMRRQGGRTLRGLPFRLLRLLRPRIVRRALFVLRRGLRVRPGHSGHRQQLPVGTERLVLPLKQRVREPDHSAPQCSNGATQQRSAREHNQAEQRFG
jgi:hypothetical protein